MLVYTHTCHPALANDNAIGMAVAAVLAGEIEEIAAESDAIGSSSAPAQSARSPGSRATRRGCARVRAGLVIGLLGDAGPLTYKRSRRGRAEIDLIAAQVVRELDPHAKVLDFTPYGYDERQFCSPGIDLPMGRLTRSANDGYPEYHTLGRQPVDCCDVRRARAVDPGDRDASSTASTATAASAPRSPKGEPRLGKRGLFRATGGTNPGDFEHAMLWLLNLSDGAHGLQDAQAASGLPTGDARARRAALVEAGLLGGSAS